MACVKLDYTVFDCEDADQNACPIVLTHGLFWNRFVYKDIAEELSQVMKCRVYTLDLRNHGNSPSTEDITLELMKEDVKQFLEDMRLTKVNFVCHSLSGCIAYLIILEKPDVVNKLVMVDGPPFCEYNEEYTTQLIATQVTSQHRLLRTLDPKMPLPQAKSKFYGLAKCGNKGQEYFYKKAAYDLIKENDVFKWKTNLNLLLKRYREKHFISKPRGTSNHEILVTRCIDSKRIYDKTFDAILKHNPRAKLVTFEDATHLLMFERQKKFVEIVKEFLSSPSDGIETRRIV